MPKNWQIVSLNPTNLQKQLLLNRNIKTKKDEECFFNTEPLYYEEELSIPGIGKAQNRIKKAIKNQELIIVYGDYDVDGVAATSLMYLGLKSLGANVLPYVPHREKEGYGLSKIGLDEAKGKNASLIVTVDNGIVAINQAKYAKELGIDLIITDHHTKLDTLPKAYALVHSIKMCGAGVAWCTLRGLIDKELENDLLQFVGLGTICDLIPLTGVGRAMAAAGLRSLNSSKRIGIKALANEAKVVVGKIGSFEVGYILGPRLNAIGRLEHALDAVRLLCTKDLLKATRLARLLVDVNIERQRLTKEVVEEARGLIDKDKKIFVLGSEKWNPGVIGLVAGRICDEFKRPVLVISIGPEISKGSARSCNGLNIVETIRKCSNLLLDIGGHPGAAGFTIQSEKINQFKGLLESQVEEIVDGYAEGVLEVEAEILSKELTFDLAEFISKLEPFGIGNTKPVFATRKMTVSSLRTLSEGKHLKFKANGIDAIGFGMGGLANQLSDGQLIDIAYNLEVNSFNGDENLQLKIADLQL